MIAKTTQKKQKKQLTPPPLSSKLKSKQNKKNFKQILKPKITLLSSKK